jgi:tetratricopeptide (TPR) repeat protein
MREFIANKIMGTLMGWFSKKSKVADSHSNELQFNKLYVAGFAAFNAGDLQQSIDLLLQAFNVKNIPLTSKTAEGWNYIGVAHMKLYDRDQNPEHLNEAEGALLMARTLSDPAFYDDYDNIGPIYNLGSCYVKQQRFAEAEKCFLEAIRRKPTADAFLRLGFICHKTERKADAEYYWEQVLKIDPTNSAAKENLENARKFY